MDIVYFRVDSVETLRRHMIRPSTQRLAVADYVLSATDHPSAEQVWERARKKAKVLSRATVYNTLNLFVERGLLRSFLVGGRVVFDPNVERHHHLIDESGRVHDVPWEAIRVADLRSVSDWHVRDYQLVMRGTRRRSRGAEVN